MKKASPFLLAEIVILATLSCTTLAGLGGEDAAKQEGIGDEIPYLSVGTVATILPGGPTPTPITAGSKSFSEAVNDDIAMILFVGLELKQSGLEPPDSSHIQICYEENIYALTIDPKSVFVSHFFADCGSSKVGDFAMSATVSLEADFAATCGYLFRAGNPGTWYMLRLTRSAGESVWSLLYAKDGIVQKVLRQPAEDANLDLSPGATTRVLLYARGKNIKVFFNARFAGEAFDPSLSAGEIGVFSSAEHRGAECRFESIWMNIYQ